MTGSEQSIQVLVTTGHCAAAPWHGRRFRQVLLSRLTCNHPHLVRRRGECVWREDYGHRAACHTLHQGRADMSRVDTADEFDVTHTRGEHEAELTVLDLLVTRHDGQDLFVIEVWDQHG